MSEALEASMGLIGDIHAEDQILSRVLGALGERGITRILCTGDVVDGRGDVNTCCALLESASVATVRGNHEGWCLEERLRDLPHATALSVLTPRSLDFLSELPATRELPVSGGYLLLCHGLGDNDMGRLTPDDQGYALAVNDDLRRLLARPGLRIVVAGHTHRRMVREIDGILFINPGSLLPDQQCGFMVLYPASSEVEGFTVDEQGEITRGGIMPVTS